MQWRRWAREFRSGSGIIIIIIIIIIITENDDVPRLELMIPQRYESDDSLTKTTETH